VIVVALVQAGSGGATVGGFVAFVTAMLMLVAPIKHLSDVMAPITRGLAAVERGLDLVDRVPAERGGSHTVARARGEIALEGVSLRFAARGGEPGPAPPPSAAAPLAESGEASPFALEDIELVIPAGQTVALIGPSGAGKTTLVSLLARFVEPTAGAVRLDGVPLREWDIAALRRQFALVSQDVVLFDDTIAANVALGAGGDSAPDPARVEAALRAAHLWDFVGSLPQGLHTNVGHNGGRLSGGQRQRVAIARAVYKDAPVLILDEATSALDNESERAVQAALAALMQGRTSIVIAHRLSTIEGAHRVLVLDRGRLVEEGTPAALLRAGGLYARLHAMQFRGGAEPAAPPAHPAHPATAAGATLR
jgi:subfamily B ATP-binding cassette protein MsbA